MIVEPTYSISVLHHLGAKMVAEIRTEPDENGEGGDVLTGYHVEPEIDISGYAEAEAELRRLTLKAEAAALRWKAETGGISVAGVPVKTDRESQAMLTGALIFIQQAGPSAVIRWKAETGFVTLDAAAVQSIAVAVGVHVQSCFDCEAQIAAKIDADEIMTAEDLAAETWPS